MAWVPLGHAGCPSGRLLVFDVGIVSLLESGQIEEVPKIAVDVKELLGDHWNAGTRFAIKALPDPDCIDIYKRVVIDLFGDEQVSPFESGDSIQSKALGECIVDFARILVADETTFNKYWKHNDSVDGLADIAFWGLHAKQVAESLPTLPEGEEGGPYSNPNLPIEEAEAMCGRIQEMKEAGNLRFMLDFRPHSHHFFALEPLRESETSSSTLLIEVEDDEDFGNAESRERTRSQDLKKIPVCLFLTSVGDGLFPVFLDEAQGKYRLRIEISGDEEE